MKLYKKIPDFNDPLKRQLFALKAATASAALEGHSFAVNEAIKEIEALKEKIAKASQEEKKKIH